jgi:hypothetical protein
LDGTENEEIEMEKVMVILFWHFEFQMTDDRQTLEI